MLCVSNVTNIKIKGLNFSISDEIKYSDWDISRSFSD